MAAHFKQDYRPIVLEKGVVPLANWSTKVCIGCSGRGGYMQEVGGVGGGTEVVVEVNRTAGEEGAGGKVVCTVSWSRHLTVPQVYPSLSSNGLDDHQSDLRILLKSVFSHPSLRLDHLVIVSGKKAWAAKLGGVVFADGGTLGYQSSACKGGRISHMHITQGNIGMDVGSGEESGVFEITGASRATNFELIDY